MATTPMNRVIQHILSTCGRDGMTDGELLSRFLSGRDDAALAALVRRHAPMVWGVCRRLLRSHHDAEDAFQATFLVLVQKAATLPDRETVGNWLYGVAHQTAVRMRAMVAKRGVRERQVTVMPEPATAEQYVWNDLAPVLDEELSRLPDKYRVLIVLCDLEGVTRKDVARRLNIPEGTAASRLATARAMLANRLARRGIVLSGVLLGAVLSQQSAWASVPTTVVSSTIKAATLVAAGHAAAGAISPTVAALTTGVTNAMFMTKIKSVLAVVLIVGLALGGIGVGVGLPTTPMAAAQRPDRKKLVPGDEQPDGKKFVAGDKDKEKLKEKLAVQGVWTLVSREANGKVAKIEEGDVEWVFTNQFCIMKERGKDRLFTYKVSPDKNPHQLDLDLRDLQRRGGKAPTVAERMLEEANLAAVSPDLQFIYEIEGNTLKVCASEGSKRATEFSTKAGSDTVLLIFKHKP